MARRAFVGGNWKCNGTRDSVAALVELLGKAEIPANADVVVAPTALHLGDVLRTLRKDIAVAAQNCWTSATHGAYTGELTVDLLADYGVPWVVAGHSERRRKVAAEPPALVGAKCRTALEAGLSVIACVGETLEERDAGDMMAVVVAQLEPVVAAANAVDGGWARVVVAYEPVWAIGTGKVATPAQAQDAHAQIRAWLAGAVSPEVAAATRIIYGGSVKAKNCQELIAQPDLDGFLVGGASLNEQFLDIIKSAGGAGSA